MEGRLSFDQSGRVRVRVRVRDRVRARVRVYKFIRSLSADAYILCICVPLSEPLREMSQAPSVRILVAEHHASGTRPESAFPDNALPPSTVDSE